MATKAKIAHRITANEFKRFADEFKNESDRAAVILGTSQLDLLLYQLIEAFLLPNASSKDELLDGDSPLATFSSRINICYRLGLIDAEFCRALHLVRKIRNSFAHEVSGVSLESGSHRERIKELVAPFVDNWALAKMIKDYFDGAENSGAQFRAVIGLMSLRLDAAVERCRRVKVDMPMDLLPPEPTEKEASNQDQNTNTTGASQETR